MNKYHRVIKEWHDHDSRARYVIDEEGDMILQHFINGEWMFTKVVSTEPEEYREPNFGLLFLLMAVLISCFTIAFAMAYVLHLVWSSIWN